MDQVLLLNLTYEPLRVISWRRAVRLLTLGKVEVVEESEMEVRSVTFVIRLPSVVRLLRLVRRRNRPVRFSRRNIYVRDGFRCQYCGRRPPVEDLTYDHVVPRALGGQTGWENIVAACVECNARKGGRTPAQAGMRLLPNFHTLGGTTLHSYGVTKSFSHYVAGPCQVFTGFMTSCGMPRVR